MASLTKTFLDGVLVGRTAALMKLFSMDLNRDGTNVDTVDPISVALGTVGVDPLTWGEIVQEDLDAIPAGDSRQVIDIAEYRLLETLHTRALSYVTTRVGTQSEVDWSDLAVNIQKKMDALKARIDKAYEADVSALVPGKIRMNTVYRKCYPPDPCY